MTDQTDTVWTPNIRRLVARKISADVIPEGGDVKDAIDFLRNPTLIAEKTHEAHEWVLENLALVRDHPDNDWDDKPLEFVAGKILSLIKHGTDRVGSALTVDPTPIVDPEPEK